jgi:hypothetical protein
MSTFWRKNNVCIFRAELVMLRSRGIYTVVHFFSLPSVQPYINPATSQHHHFSPKYGESMSLQIVGFY